MRKLYLLNTLFIISFLSLVSAQEQLTQTGSQLFSGLITGTIWLFLGLIVASAILGVFIFIRWKRKFDIKVEVISERANGNNVYYFDKAAILTERETKHKYFRLLETKVDLPVPPYNVLQNFGKKDLLRIWRKSEDEFVFLLPGRINKRYIIKQNGKAHSLAREEYTQVESDIAYWNIKRKNQHKKLFDTESVLMKLIPFLPHIFAGAITIFVIYILFDSLPGLISSLTQLTKELQILRTPTTPEVVTNLVARLL